MPLKLNGQKDFRRKSRSFTKRARRARKGWLHLGAQLTYEGVVFKAPGINVVLTQRFRSNWILNDRSSNEIRTEQFNVRTPNKFRSRVRSTAQALQGLTLKNNNFFLENNSPYARALEDGSSEKGKLILTTATARTQQILKAKSYNSLVSVGRKYIP